MRAVRPDELGQTALVRTRWAASVLLLILLTACVKDPVSPAPRATQALSQTEASLLTPTDPTTERPSAKPSTSRSPGQRDRGTKIVAAESDFGTILFDATGQAIYMFDAEPTTEPRCYQACAEAWPPVLTGGAPLAGQRVEQSQLGTTPRTDGTTQVTYGGHPLYFYAHEGKHEVRCHDVYLNGGNWYAVQPNGHPAP
jgi:predicted lipoprotein with Yx(FWY)xxD motif